MHYRFNFDPTLVKGVVTIFSILVLLMAVFSLLSGPSFRPVIFLILAGGLLILFWIGFSRGSYITVDGKNIYGTVFLSAERLLHWPPLYPYEEPPLSLE